MNDKPISLSNLTADQVEMLDILWSLGELSDVEEWQSTLEPEDREMSDALIKLVILETMDEIITSDLSDAQEVLQKFTLKA
jgi:DNA gyrase/topoisomerase IV subunit B